MVSSSSAQPTAATLYLLMVRLVLKRSSFISKNHPVCLLNRNNLTFRNARSYVLGVLNVQSDILILLPESIKLSNVVTMET